MREERVARSALLTNEPDCSIFRPYGTRLVGSAECRRSVPHTPGASDGPCFFLPPRRGNRSCDGPGFARPAKSGEHLSSPRPGTAWPRCPQSETFRVASHR